MELSFKVKDQAGFQKPFSESVPDGSSAASFSNKCRDSADQMALKTHLGWVVCVYVCILVQVHVRLT